MLAQDMDVLRQVGGVVVVFSLLGASLWLARRGGRVAIAGKRFWTPATKTKKLTAVEKLSLTPQHTLHIVRVDGRELIVATHPQGCTLLSEKQAEIARGASA